VDRARYTRLAPRADVPVGELKRLSDIPSALGAPYTNWGVDGIDSDLYRAAEKAGRVIQNIPVNHSAGFAPVIQPTLDTGTKALVVAALAWL